MAATADHFGTLRKSRPKAVGTTTGMFSSVKKSCMRLNMPNWLLTKMTAMTVTNSPRPTEKSRPDLQQFVVSGLGPDPSLIDVAGEDR